ncbi:hypothetical protein [Thiothrix fructosivorans]|uniref:Uncharacterized protein n=1 Tax=Thiothrix fructosivorans TaxID=111770 RepID=A0A8B0SLN8_9GAMM|nr:hypothetical protein [Thiothrix fructosivorans]MBO0611703.1 hypothetical protein [Thiothrix fructosivorans]QTX10637.1 hypothetical protein J1836_019065 [Thiothrix fructosivorans]
MSGGSKTQTTSTKVDLPPEVQAMMDKYFGEVGNLYDSGYTPTAGINTQQNYALDSAMSGQQNLASDVNQSRGLLTKTVAGDFLNANPYFDQTVSRALGGITDAYQTATAPQTDANFARANAFGGSAWRGAVDRNERNLAEALGSTENQMRSGNFQQERAAQMQAAGMLPSLDTTQLQGAQGLLGMGTAMQDLTTKQNNAPLDRIGLLQQALAAGMGTAGQSQTGANPNYRSPLQTALSLGALFV